MRRLVDLAVCTNPPQASPTFRMEAGLSSKSATVFPQMYYELSVPKILASLSLIVFPSS